MSYEKYKEYRLAPDDNGCWSVLDRDYQQMQIYSSKAAAKRAIDKFGKEDEKELTALKRFMEKQGWRWDNITNAWILEPYGHNDPRYDICHVWTAEHWYTSLAEQLKPVEHTAQCNGYTKVVHRTSCVCGADQVNAVLAERRKRAGL